MKLFDINFNALFDLEIVCGKNTAKLGTRY